MDQSERLQQAIDLLTSITPTANSQSSGEESAGHASAQPQGSRSRSQSSGEESAGHASAQPQQGSRSRPHRETAGLSDRLTSSCSRALDTIRSFRNRMHASSEVVAEQKANFAPYRRPKSSTKGQSWTVKVVCLFSRDATRVPCSSAERELLVQAGLGEKKIVIPDINCSGQEFRDLLTSAFPKLAGCGGFDLLRCVPNTKQLEVMSVAVTQSPKLLKSVVSSGRIFVRPIQKDLELDLDEGLTPSLQINEKCIRCGILVSVHELRKHVQACMFKRTSMALDTSDDDFEEEPLTKVPHIDISSDEEVLSPVMFKECEDVADTEKVMVDHAIAQSAATCSSSISQPMLQQSATTISDIIKMLAQCVVPEENTILIRRGHVLEDALRSVKRTNFPLDHTIKVEFLGEAGEDGGGPRREFWALLSREIQSSLFEGDPSRCVLRHDAVGLQANKFYYVGQLMVLSVVQGGSGYPYMASPVYQYLCGADISRVNVSVEDVPNYEVQYLLKQIGEASNDETLQKVCMEGVDFILEADYSKPITSITMSGKQAISDTLMLHYTLYRNKAVLDQLKCGLQTHKVLDAMSKYSEVMEHLFVFGKKTPLSVDMIKKLLSTIHFSDSGTTERTKEEATYMLFIDLLYECEEDEIPGVTLGQVLNFFTGAEYPPPLGFDIPVSLRFSPTSDFPLASTCALELTLPTKYHNDPEMFKSKILYGFQNHRGFRLL